MLVVVVAGWMEVIVAKGDGREREMQATTRANQIVALIDGSGTESTTMGSKERV